MLPESARKDLAIEALARSTTISDLSVQHGVSRKFVYQQAHKAGAALDEVFGVVQKRPVLGYRCRGETAGP